MDDNYPEMKKGSTYNSSVVPVCFGTQVYKFKDIFEDLSPNDTGYVEVSIPDDGKIYTKGGNEFFVDRFTFVDRTKLTGSVIQSLINSNVNVEAGPYRSSLVDWAITNESVSTLIYIADKCSEVLDIMYSYMNILVTKKIYISVIESLINKGYNIHKNDDSLFLFAASGKDHELCKLLLEKGAFISKQVMYMYKANKGKYPEMESLLEKYKDRVI